MLGAHPPPDDAVALRPTGPEREPIYFEKDPGWAIELAARGGLGALAASDARGAFAFGGGLLRVRYKHYELGGFGDKSDNADAGGGFTHFGGFAGAWLPYHNWVDFEVAAAIGSRHYTDPDPRYGSGGYSLGLPALSFIVGVSDRARSGNRGIGGRVGSQIVMTGDLGQKDVPWHFLQQSSTGEVVETKGSTHVGGVSVSLVFTLAIDYGEGP
ncbi:MAG TPA: hypothetical protein VNN72_00735 [Polyangiaceae bacterium]|nr:hypothetical protein [Polyangiaceae bacterium]